MGASHARAYHKMPEFEIVGLVSRGPTSREALSKELGGLPEFSDYYDALAATRPDAVSINTYPETHAPVRAGGARGGLPRVLREAAGRDRRGGAGDRGRRVARDSRKLVIGYILRVHPAWVRVHRDRAHAGQAAGDAHEPEPAEPRARRGTRTAT